MKSNYLLFSALAAFTIAACSPKIAEQKIGKNISSPAIPIDSNVIIGKLPNGLTYYIRKNVEPKNRAELYLDKKEYTKALQEIILVKDTSVSICFFNPCLAI